jgi:hypothetical protein
MLGHDPDNEAGVQYKLIEQKTGIIIQKLNPAVQLRSSEKNERVLIPLT